jgi:hypothetical protein
MYDMLRLWECLNRDFQRWSFSDVGVSGAGETQIVVEAETIFDVPANGIYYTNLVVIGVPIIPPTNGNSAKLLP